MTLYIEHSIHLQHYFSTFWVLTDNFVVLFSNFGQNRKLVLTVYLLRFWSRIWEGEYWLRYLWAGFVSLFFPVSGFEVDSNSEFMQWKVHKFGPKFHVPIYLDYHTKIDFQRGNELIFLLYLSWVIHKYTSKCYDFCV